MHKYLKDEFKQDISINAQKALSFCSRVADDNNLQIFLIGGIVRDLIIKEKNFDIDITVQGNAVEFAKMLEKTYPGQCKVKEIHDSFKTAKISFQIAGETVDIDLASTRKESYPYPSSLPKIEEIGCELYEDVIRRDFTINSMALSLNSSSFCRLIDYIEGYKHLKEGILEVIHPLSFIDDPTRIIRGLKFSVRFGYRFGENTQKLMESCLNSGQFDNLAGERVKLELKQTFNLNKAECLRRFMDENIFKLVDTSLVSKNLYDFLPQQCEKTVVEYENYIKNKENVWLIYLGVLLASAEPKKISEIAQKLNLSGNEECILLQAQTLYQNKDALASAGPRFEVYEFFENKEIESMLIFLILNKELKDKFDLYLRELKEENITINGDTLIKMGIKPSPLFKKTLRETLKARINKEITSADEEIEFAKKFLNL